MVEELHALGEAPAKWCCLGRPQLRLRDQLQQPIEATDVKDEVRSACVLQRLGRVVEAVLNAKEQRTGLGMGSLQPLHQTSAVLLLQPDAAGDVMQRLVGHLALLIVHLRRHGEVREDPERSQDDHVGELVVAFSGIVEKGLEDHDEALRERVLRWKGRFLTDHAVVTPVAWVLIL